MITLQKESEENNMSFIFWLIMCCLVFAFATSLFASIGNNNFNKREELLKAVVFLTLIILFNKVWG